ncbi:MAG: hypothetical protein LLG00_01440 [Planctomycetaceae bacterium]|nr:hypothetical protein [Planctomycetaceae bacterium]
MMSKMHGIFSWVVLALIVAGCGKSSDTRATASGESEPATVASNAAKADGPGAAVAEFLEAVRTGNDDKATQMLSSQAREKTASLNRNVTPPASDTAKFTIGKVEMVDSGNGARVFSTWTDLDADGQRKTDEAIWVVRREPEGWRVAGVAATVFPGEPPLVLSFEDPDDMLRKQQWVREEIRRRMEKEQAGLQAQGSEKPEKPVLR